MSLGNSVVYDIETYPITESNLTVDPNNMRLSVAVTFDERNDYKVWYEEDAEELINYLLLFDKIIGYNIKHFDNSVLTQYKNSAKDALDKKSIDMLEVVEKRLGNRISLQSIVSPTLNVSKSADGLQALKWWKDGNREMVVKYCMDDVKITKELYLHGQQKGEILYESLGEIRKLKIDWNNLNAKFDSVDFTYRLTDDDNGNTIELDKENKEFFQALELARTTNQLIYLTGKAGTGKTTFLKYLKKSISKRAAVVAYTGVAAINAGGQTIHSFFKINPDEPPFLPNDRRLRLKAAPGDPDTTTIFSHFQYNQARREIFRSLELLIIDEVSMVRADLIDVIDKLLRAFSGRNRNLPFGGVQVILIGDTFQLPPIEGQEWNILSEYYESPFFFSSIAFKQNLPLYIELKKIYRQNEIEFIDLLNRIRVNQPSQNDLQILNAKVQTIGDRHFDENYIVLCSTNAQVNQINSVRLSSLLTAERTYIGEITGQFPNSVRITEQYLTLKEGAQIMFLKNGLNYYNGKIGNIEEVQDDSITASTTNSRGEKTIFRVEKHTWKNVRYTLNREANRIEQEVIGTFTQYPIKLAWAITVHKSQGLTFEKVVVDINNFAPPGLVYVALSRCISMNGLILRSPIIRQAINTDNRVIEFAQNITPETLIVDVINQGKADFLYRGIITEIKQGREDIAFDVFLKAIKFRNDIETKGFRRYVMMYLKKIRIYKEIANSLTNEKLKLIRELTESQKNQKDQSKVIEGLQNKFDDFSSNLNKASKLITNQSSKIKALESEIKALSNHLIKARSDNDELAKLNQDLKNEVARLNRLTWLDKLIGRT